MGGYFKVWRKIEDSKSWSRGALYRGLMITLLQKANWKQGYFHGQEILPGQLACSGASLASELDLSRYQVMRMLATLEDDGFISRQDFRKSMHVDYRRELAVIPVCYGRGRTAAAQRAHKRRTGSAHDRRREESKKRNPSCIRRCSGGAGFPFGEGKAGRRRGAHRFRTRYEQRPQICRTRYRGRART